MKPTLTTFKCFTYVILLTFSLSDLFSGEAPLQIQDALHPINLNKNIPTELERNKTGHASSCKILISLCGDEIIKNEPEIKEMLLTCAKFWHNIDAGNDRYFDHSKRLTLINKISEKYKLPPILIYWKALALADIGDLDNAIKQLQDCIELSKMRNDSTELLYLCTKKIIRLKWILACRHDGNFTAERLPLEHFPDFFAYMSKAIKERKFIIYVDDRALLSSILGTIESNGLPYKGSVDALLQDLDESPNNWLVLTTKGACYLEKAWEARGGGYANTVQQDKWPVFYKYLGLARASLEKAWEMDPSKPESSDLMIRVSMSEGREKIDQRLWFDRSLSAERDRFASFEHLFFAFTPRWGGSLEMINAIGEAALATQDFDSLLPLRYLDAIYYIRNHQVPETTIEEKRLLNEFFQSEQTVNKTKILFDGYLKRGDTELFKIDYLNFKYAFTVGYEQRQLKLGKEILERNGMDYINSSQHKILGLTPRHLYSNLNYLNVDQESKRVP